MQTVQAYDRASSAILEARLVCREWRRVQVEMRACREARLRDQARWQAARQALFQRAKELAARWARR